MKKAHETTRGRAHPLKKRIVENITYCTNMHILEEGGKYLNRSYWIMCNLVSHGYHYRKPHVLDQPTPN